GWCRKLHPVPNRDLGETPARRAEETPRREPLPESIGALRAIEPPRGLADPAESPTSPAFAAHAYIGKLATQRADPEQCGPDQHSAVGTIANPHPPTPQSKAATNQIGG